LPDTARNQKRYPQPSSQKPGCGFPLLKFLVLFSLSSGAILRVALAHWKNHDLRLLHGLWEALEKGDILLGDRAYGEYLTLAALPAKGVDVVAADAWSPPRGLSQSHKTFAPPRWSFSLWKELVRTLTRDLVPLRPNRQEPRAVKRRPKAYQLLNKPRHLFKEVPHRCRYYNKNTRKNRGLI